MEKKSQTESLKPSQNPPFRRRPLQSQTYRTFVQIISHCHALHSLPQHKGQGEVAAVEDRLVGVNRLGEAAEPNELLDHDPMETESMLLQQNSAANDTKEAIGETGEAAEEFKSVGANRLGEAAKRNELLDRDPMEIESMLLQQNSVANDTKEASNAIKGDLLDAIDVIADNNNSNHVYSFLEANQTIDGVFNMNTGQNDGSDVVDTTEVSLTVDNVFNMNTGQNDGSDIGNATEVSLTVDNVFNMNTGQKDGSDVGDASEVSLTVDNVFNMNTGQKDGSDVGNATEVSLIVDNVFNMNTGQKDGSDVGDATEVSRTRQEEMYKQDFLGEVADSSLDMDMVAEFSRDMEDGKKNYTEEKELGEGIEHQLQLTEKEFEKLICTSGAMDSSVCLTANDDIEEGEISGDLGDYDVEFLLGEAVSLEEKKGEEAQIHLDINDTEEIARDGGESGLGKYGRSFSASLNIVDNRGDIMKLDRQIIRKDPDAYAGHWAERNTEIRKVDGNDIFLETGQIIDQVPEVNGTNNRATYVKDLASQGQVMSEGRAENKDLVNNKDNDIEKKKRKRGTQSKENKQKKKRIKRAEKNRKLGVNRLKLQPTVKPKTVTYCRHYLKGRCQEGEKCKFSHDITPLTKSQPCCHFARHSCMKGDACPFDHELSKYPCNNYIDKGFCSRGVDCLFSHKIADREDSSMTPNVPKPELKSPFQTSHSNSKNQVQIHGNPPQNSSCKSSEKKVAQYLQKPATQVPKGICVFSPLGLSPGDKSKHEQAAQPLKGDSGVKTCHEMINSSSGSCQKSNDLSKRLHITAPKGINFLSFGKATPLDSGGNNDHGISESSLREPNENALPRLPSKNDGGAKTENQSGQSSLESESSNDKTANMISPASRPQGIKFLAFGDISRDNSSSVGLALLLRQNINSGLPFVQERANVQDGLKLSNEMPCRLASSSNPFRPSSYQSGPRNDYKLVKHTNLNAVEVLSSQKISLLSNTPISVQKALQSTLAFAAKLDSQVMRSSSL